MWAAFLPRLRDPCFDLFAQNLSLELGEHRQ
jgi:hypothetical protein